ncbi:MAG: cysteine--tRNA ligase, partial [Chloroherpetonaceae bacterium]
QAIAIFFDLAREVNSTLSRDGFSEPIRASVIDFFKTYGREILGILSETPIRTHGEAAMLNGVMRLVLDIRKDVRAKKDFATSDLIRDRLREVGIEVKDTKEGATWRPLD